MQIIVVEFKSCRHYEELDRKATVKKFKASATVYRRRRTMVGACERMCAYGVDRCDGKVTAVARIDTF